MTQPLVSVVMPVRNEGEFLRTSLAAVLGQDYPRNKVEVIVADGMSDDGTREIVRELQATDSRLRLIDNPARVAPAALNRAIATAAGDIVVRVDGHTVVASDYVRACVTALDRSGAETVGGRMDAESASPFGHAVALATSSRFGVGGARFHYSQAEELVDTVYLGAWRRDVFERFGMFDEELVRNQDDEFNYRIQAGGGRVLLSPSIRSRYFARSTPRALWRQYFQYGLWKVRVMQKHPAQMRRRHFVPPLFVAALAVSAAMAPAAPMSALVFSSIAATYTLAVMAGAAIVSRRPGRGDLLPRVAIAFAILHVAYGSGFLVGLGRFAGKWRAAAAPVLNHGQTDI